MLEMLVNEPRGLDERFLETSQRKVRYGEELQTAVAARLKKQKHLKARVERTLQENEPRLLAIATTTLHPIIMMDPDGWARSFTKC